MENRIALWESEIAKTMNRLRKIATGKGAKRSEVRIANNVIFVKLQVELSELETNLIKFIQQDPIREAEYLEQIREPLRQSFKDSFNYVHPNLFIENIHFKVDLRNRLTFAILVMNMDIEEMIRSGTVGLPKKVNDTPHEKR